VWEWIWIIVGIAVLVGLYVWLYLFTRKRQRDFDEQYLAAKQRFDVFVLNKKIVREAGQSRWLKYMKFKTYQVVGRVNVTQKVKGVQMSRMQVMSFHTTKSEYEKIHTQHRYKMDIAGNYIGFVLAPAPGKQAKQKGKSAKTETPTGKWKIWKRSARKGNPRGGSQDKAK
jgi:hypothetical protein